MAEICDQNFDVLCRLCLNHIDGDFVPIFDNDPIYHTATVKDKIYFITAILVSPEDRLPAQICGLCDDRINDCYTFKQQSTINNVKLLKYLQQREDLNVAKPSSLDSCFPRSQRKSDPATDADHLPLGNAGHHPRNPQSPPANGTHAAAGPAPRKRNYDDGEDDMTDEAMATRVAVVRAGKATKHTSDISASSPDEEGKEKPDEDGSSEKSSEQQREKATSKKSRVLWTMRTRGKAQKRSLALGNQLRPSRGHDDSDAPYTDYDIFKYLRLNDLSALARLKQAQLNAAAMTATVKEERPASLPVVVKERKCPECGSRFTTLHDLRDHKTATGHTIPGCALCGKKFLTREARDNHIAKKHLRALGGDGDRPKAKKTLERRCHECGEAYESLPELRAHQDKAGHRMAPVCKICGIIYKSFEAREKHMSKRHGGKGDVAPPDIARLLCNVCDKRFKSKDDLATHLTEHAAAATARAAAEATVAETTAATTVTAVKKYECELCEERFFNTSELRVHFEAKHDGSDVQLFQCLFCEATLSSPKALRSHFTRVHKPDSRSGGDRGGSVKVEVNKYTCAICLQTFSSKATLNEHVRTHKQSRAGPRLELDPLRLHKLHECEVCGESFKYNTTKKSHVLKFHASEEEEEEDDRRRVKVEECEVTNKKKVKRHSCDDDSSF